MAASVRVGLVLLGLLALGTARPNARNVWTSSNSETRDSAKPGIQSASNVKKSTADKPEVQDAKVNNLLKLIRELQEEREARSQVKVNTEGDPDKVNEKKANEREKEHSKKPF